MKCPLHSSEIKDVEVSGQFLVKFSKTRILEVWFSGSRVVAFLKTEARSDDSNKGTAGIETSQKSLKMLSGEGTSINITVAFPSVMHFCDVIIGVSHIKLQYTFLV
jgi:hypothetical protein